MYTNQQHWQPGECEYNGLLVGCKKARDHFILKDQVLEAKKKMRNDLSELGTWSKLWWRMGRSTCVFQSTKKVTVVQIESQNILCISVYWIFIFSCWLLLNWKIVFVSNDIKTCTLWLEKTRHLFTQAPWLVLHYRPDWTCKKSYKFSQ